MLQVQQADLILYICLQFGVTSATSRFNYLYLTSVRCYKCNKPGHFARDCKMEGERCYNCNKIGHIARDCDREIDEGIKDIC